MPTSARPHPSLNAMLLCDLTIREHATGKMSLIGIFENISAARFPVVHRALTVYAKLADAEGEYGIRLELIRLDDSHVVAQGTLHASFADRMTPGELTVNLENLGFERPGRYEFRLYADERFVASKSFTVIQSAPAPYAQLMRVLILTASYGSGHNAAAHSLAAAFADRGAEVTVVDHFRELVHPLFDRASRATYMALLRRAPMVWGAAYALGDWLPSDSPLAFGMTRIGTGRLAALLDALAPDAVVSVHATPAAAMSALAAEGRRVPPHTTVVTDFVAHSQWLARGIDRYCVADADVGHEFVARGIPRERVVVTGVPVRAEFDAAIDGVTARRTLGLTASLPVVLAMAGSNGSVGRLPDMAWALTRLSRPVQGVLVTGRDAALAESLTRQTAGTGVRVLGFVPEVRSLMGAADLLITKAGGMTLAEAIAAELPMLLYGSLPGQERHNERFATRAGIALAARSKHELLRRLERALSEPELIEHLRESVRRVRHPHAAQRIVAAVVERSRLRS